MQENQEDGELSNTFLVHKILQLMRNFTIMLLNFFYVTDDGYFFFSNLIWSKRVVREAGFNEFDSQYHSVPDHKIQLEWYICGKCG